MRSKIMHVLNYADDNVDWHSTWLFDPVYTRTFASLTNKAMAIKIIAFKIMTKNLYLFIFSTLFDRLYKIGKSDGVRAPRIWCIWDFLPTTSKSNTLFSTSWFVAAINFLVIFIAIATVTLWWACGICGTFSSFIFWTTPMRTVAVASIWTAFIAWTLLKWR